MFSDFYSKQICFLLASSVVLLTTIGAAKAIEISARSIHNAGHPTTESIQHMGGVLTERSDGEITVSVLDSIQQSDVSEVLQQVQLGALDMAVIPVDAFGAFDENFYIFGLPYIFRTRNHMHKVVDGAIGERLLDGLNTSGFIGLGFIDVGTRSFYNRERSIRKPDDLSGLKIRVIANPIFNEVVNDLGGDSVLIAFNELYSSLQAGMIDGGEDTPLSYLTHKHFEVAGFYSLTEHLILPEVVVFSKKVWDSLKKEHQALIREASSEAIRKSRELLPVEEQQAIGMLDGLGVKIDKEVDKAAFIKAMVSAREDYSNKYADLLSEIEAIE